MIRLQIFRVFLVALFFTTKIWAMTPGPTIVRECPHCHTALSEFTIGSGNSFGARCWTDLKVYAPMMPDFPWLVKCPKCKRSFWIDEAKELGESGWGGESKTWRSTWSKAPVPSPALPADFLKLLAGSKLPREKELYARRQIWWTANDPARAKTNIVIQFTPEQEKSLQALACLLDEKDPNERIQKAEIFRELGRFTDCTALLLTKPFKTEDQAKTATFIYKLAVQKTKVVREIKEETKPVPKKPIKPKTGI